MGTDIHPRAEVRQDGVWRCLPHLPECAKDRNYDLFAILADVRNGRGFAGCLTGEGFVPIAEPRGLPGDLAPPLDGRDLPVRWRYESFAPFAEIEASEVRSYQNDVGDHSQSWVTLQELLAYDWQQTTTCFGLIPAVEDVKARVLATVSGTGDDHEQARRSSIYELRQAYHITTEPDSYCGGVGGPNIKEVWAKHYDGMKAAGTLEPGITYYVRVAWTVTYAESARAFYTHVIPWLEQQAKLAGVTPADCRLVFGFDS